MATETRSGVLQVRKVRRDGWTAAARGRFLAELAATSNVKASCRAVGKSFSGLYHLRARDPGFARDWDVALEQGYQRIEAELLRRAMGDAVGETLAAAELDGDGPANGAPAEPPLPFDPDLAMRLLAHRRAQDGAGRRSRVQMKRPDPEAVLKALDRKLTAMEKRLGRGA